MSISDFFNSSVFENSVLDSSEYHSPLQGANVPMSITSEIPALPKTTNILDLPSEISDIFARPYINSSSSDDPGTSMAALKTTTVNEKTLDCFKVNDRLLLPVVDLVVPDTLVVSMYKKWISLAWNVREAEVKKPKSSSGGRVWIAEVECLNRTITIRKYKKDSEEYWKVTHIGPINNSESESDAKKRKIDNTTGYQSSDRDAYEFVEPPSSLSSVADVPPIITKRVSESRFTPKYEILAFIRLCISQIRKDQLEFVFIDTVNAANCFRPRFRPYEGEKAEHPRSEYVDYSDADAIVTEENRVLDCISWSYRLALQRYHMFFVEFIGDTELQRRLMKCKVDDVPNNLNPLTSIDSEVMKEVKVRTQSFSREKRQAFIDHAAENMEFHLTVGLMNKDHIIDRSEL